ncbi:MAG: TonB-dependent receptor [Acidobacteria bacterium]|nr:TonB-dependent receptor [Acidobacteriota bacterium]
MVRLFLPCLLVSLVGLLPVSLDAQASSGILTGIVLDSTRAALPRVTVRLIDPAGTEVARTLTDTRGRFRFEGLGDVSYKVQAALTGFETTTATGTPGAELEIVLPVAPVREQVVVTATRTDAPSGQLGASTTVISGEELENRLLLPVSDALRPIAGSTVVRSGGVGAITSLFVRGGESDFNKVLLDGIVLNEPGGTFFLDNLMAENLERVEVVRGPQSALFGSDAMTSVVQLFTRQGKAETARPRFSLSAEGGNNDTWRLHGGVTGQAGFFDYSYRWARLSTDNREPNNTFHNTTFSGNFGLNFNERTSLRLILRGDLGRVGTPGQTAFGRPDRDAFFRRRDGDVGITLRNQTTHFWEQRLTYSFAKSRQVSRNLIADPPFVPQFEGQQAPFPSFDFPFDFLNDNRRHHLSYQSDWHAGQAGRPAGQHVFTFAFEWDRELGAFGDRLFGGLPVQADRDNFGYVFQHQVFWRRLFFTNGFRVEDNDSFGTSVVPRSSVAYLLRQGASLLGATKLKFNFGLGIKEPTLLESFSPSPFFLGNPSLAPERTRSFDAGVEQRFWSDRGKLEVNWFDNRFRDLIAFQFDLLTFTGTFENIGRSKAKGAEVILELAPGWGLRGVGTYTFLDSQITRSAQPFSAVFREGQPLFRRPRQSGSLRVFWDWKRLTITSSTVFVGKRVDSDFAGIGLTSNDGYTKWDLAGHYRSAHQLTYFAGIENLLNQNYMEALGFPALKLTFRAGARVDF